MPEQKMPTMSINNRKDLYALFKKELEEVEKEILNVTDPSILRKGAATPLKVLEQNFNDLKTGINNAINVCGALKGESHKIIEDTISDAKELILKCFGDFRKHVNENEDDFMEIMENFIDTYGDKVSSWKNAIESKIKGINKDILTAKFEYDNRMISLEEIVEGQYEYILSRNEKTENYLTIDKISDALTALKGQCPSPAGEKPET